MFKRLLILVIVLITSIAPLATLRAQDNTITLTVTIPSFATDIFTDATFLNFEQAHPNVKVKVVPKDAFLPSPANGVDAYLSALRDYVTAADVLEISSNWFAPEATRAGYLLDLAPLANADNSLNADDFYPAVWKSFQWDRGIWALPTSADAVILSYKPSAFDAAGIAYPDAHWTMDDLANAARKLAQRDANGKVTAAPLFVIGGLARQAMLQSLIGDSLFDSATSPDTLHFTSTAAEKVLTTWNQLNNEGLFGTDNNTAAISVVPSEFLGMQTTNAEKSVGVALPGGKLGLQTEGYGVSAGTQHPTEAYELAKFLTTQVAAVGPFNSSSARKSLANRDNGNTPLRRFPVSPEAKALLDQALADGLTVSDLRYADYLNQVLSDMKSMDAHTALQTVEAQVLANQKAAADGKGKVALVVATPVAVSIPQGKITLKFGMSANISPMSNTDQWNKLAQDFAASDPQVGLVALDPNHLNDLSQLADKYDCFYLPYNAVPGANLSKLLSLDPFLAADKSFNKNDVVGNVLTQLQQDNKTWGLPLTIEPQLLSYDSEQFTKANVPAPTSGWTLAAFNDALKALKKDAQHPPFEPNSPGATHLLILMAAFGGLPIDYRTDPPAIHFTDPATVQAIRQVLDLARNGLLKYGALGTVSQIMIFAGGRGAPIVTQALGGLRIRLAGGPTGGVDPYKAVTFPAGSQYNGISYGVGTAYISAKSQNPDACYRWISTIAQHSELFLAMPARRSMIHAPAVVASQGADVIAAYDQIDALLKDPKTVSFPSLFQGGGKVSAGFVVEHWLNEAFDAYVLQNADLDSALKNAETYAQGFQTCSATIPPFDPSSAQTINDYNKAYLACAVKVDSRLKDFAKGISN